MEMLGEAKHPYTVRTNNGLNPYGSIPNERLNELQILNTVEEDEKEYTKPLRTSTYGCFLNKQINLPTSPNSLEHQPAFVLTPAAERSPNEKKLYSSPSQKLRKELLIIFENPLATNKPSEGNLPTVAENDRSSSRLQQALLTPTFSEFSSDNYSLNIPDPSVTKQHAVFEIRSDKSSEKVPKNDLPNFTRKMTDHPYVKQTTSCSQTFSCKSSSGFLEQINPSLAEPSGTGATFSTQRPQNALTGAKQYSRRTVVEHSPLEASIEQINSECSQRETSVKPTPNPAWDKATIHTCLCVVNVATVTFTPVAYNIFYLMKQPKTLVSKTNTQQISQKQIGNWAYWSSSVSSDISFRNAAGSQRVQVDQQQANLKNSFKPNNSIDRALQTENFHVPVAPADGAQTNQLLPNQLKITTRLGKQNIDGQLDDSVHRIGLYMLNKTTPIISVSAHLGNVKPVNLPVAVDFSYTTPCHNVEFTVDHNTVSHLLLCRLKGYDPDETQSKRTHTPNIEALKEKSKLIAPRSLSRLQTENFEQLITLPNLCRGPNLILNEMTNKPDRSPNSSVGSKIELRHQSDNDNRTQIIDEAQQNASLSRQVVHQYYEETFLLNETNEVDLDVLDRLTRLWIGGTREMGQRSDTQHIPT
ncbi:hypothetical protein P879_08022 [Paragonimus westermani]|uniref:Uncharacterized protein n=1 Tax=Paragonimus westermani TaxID=34504 RepID=A0A8T0DDD0_9TREM|nr:hypothetical protein P879_08022 [Paragonimus westermani]